MGRILAFDYGEKRIGIAVSDEMQILSQMPVPALKNDAKVYKKIDILVRKYEVEKFLLGLPLAMSGQETESTDAARRFGEKLKQKFNLALEFVDERLSTVFSGRMLDDKGVRRAEKKDLIDNQSAQIILEDYLRTKK